MKTTKMISEGLNEAKSELAEFRLKIKPEGSEELTDHYLFDDGTTMQGFTNGRMLSKLVTRINTLKWVLNIKD